MPFNDVSVFWCNGVFIVLYQVNEIWSRINPRSLDLASLINYCCRSKIAQIFWFVRERSLHVDLYHSVFDFFSQ